MKKIAIHLAPVLKNFPLIWITSILSVSFTSALAWMPGGVFTLLQLNPSKACWEIWLSYEQTMAEGTVARICIEKCMLWYKPRFVWNNGTKGHGWFLRYTWAEADKPMSQYFVQITICIFAKLHLFTMATVTFGHYFFYFKEHSTTSTLKPPICGPTFVRCIFLVSMKPTIYLEHHSLV